MTKQSFPSAPAATQRRLAALIQLLVNVPAWVRPARQLAAPDGA
jgi:hypothetical protein